MGKKKVGSEFGLKPSQVATVLGRYAKFKQGRAARIGASPYELACEALAMDGLRRPSHIGGKTWAIMHLAHALEELKKAPAGLFRSKSAQMQWVRDKKAMAAADLQAKLDDPNRTPVFSAGAVVAGGVNVVSDDFLRTFEWRRVRMVALKKYGPVCQCCGDTPANGAVMNVDHIKPRRLFPHLALDVDNLQILCGPCNHGKGSWDMTDWRESQPAKATQG